MLKAVGLGVILGWGTFSLITTPKKKGLFLRLGFGMDFLPGIKPDLGKRTAEDSWFLSLASHSDFLLVELTTRVATRRSSF